MSYGRSIINKQKGPYVGPYKITRLPLLYHIVEATCNGGFAMWTTYSPYLYACESMSVDEDRDDKEINIEDVLPDGWVVLDGEDEKLPF